MSILIKGETLPKYGTIHIAISPNGEVFDDNSYIPEPVAHAVEIPPHGRLIDADELIKNCEIWKETEIQDEHDDVWNRGIDACINEVKHHVPTVIESENE